MNENENVSRRDFLQRLSLFGAVGVGAGSLLVGCGGSSTDSSSSATTSEQSSAGGGGQASEGGEAAKTVTLHPKGNQMKYRETEFTVPSGEKVKLVFENTATSPSMQHNVVVLNTGPKEEVFKRVGEAGMQAGSTNDYVSEDSAILAHTPITAPGETVSVTFTTPEEPGKYGYLCTYPGHWATMQGTMVVQG